MARISGITTNLDARRKQYAGEKKTMRGWTATSVFPTREAALKWLKAQPGEHDPNTAPAPGSWFGFTFEY